MSTNISGTLDTTGVEGGENTHPEDDPAQYLDGTPDTSEPGGPIRHIDQPYQEPSNYTDASGYIDTTRTDLPISDGVEHLETSGNMSGTIDTVNLQSNLQTTTGNDPATPGGAPTVVALERKVRVTITPLADPAGAKIKYYVVEGNTGGTRYINDGETSVEVDNLTPSQVYKFRYAGVNDNGRGAWSPWSANVTPTLQEKPLFDHMSAADTAQPDPIADPAGIAPENLVNPIYKPDGSTKGTTAAPPATAVMAATASVGALKVDWTAPPWTSDEITGYRVTLSTGETIDKGVVLTHTFTGLSIVARTATVRALTAGGLSAAKATNAATPLA